jgi:hypothetical protein
VERTKEVLHHCPSIAGRHVVTVGFQDLRHRTRDYLMTWSGASNKGLELTKAAPSRTPRPSQLNPGVRRPPGKLRTWSRLSHLARLAAGETWSSYG